MLPCSGTEHLRHHAAVEVQLRADTLVHAAGRQHAVAVQLQQRRAGTQALLQRPAAEGQVVDADVEQRAAGLDGVEEAVSWVVGQVKGEAAVHGAQCADLAAAQPQPHFVVERQETCPQRFHQEEAAAARQRDELLRFGGRGHQRLFTQHRQAGVQAGAHGIAVEGVGRGNVDGVEVAARQQRRHRRVRTHRKRAAA